MKDQKISIVIVSYNVSNFLIQTLKSVFGSDVSAPLDVWVVDNASVDNSVEAVRKMFPQVKLIANKTNTGFATANNQAIHQINSKYILLLNPDTVLQEDTLEVCYQYMEKKAEVGALGVRMIDGTGEFLPESKRQIPTIWNSFCKLTYLSDLFPKSKWFSGYNLGYLPEDKEAEIDVLCGAFMFIRGEALDTVGVLDEAFFMYGEDIDLSYRIQKGGYKIIYLPATSIIHYKGESTKKSSLSYIKTFYGAMDIYVRKHYTATHGNFFARIISLAIWIRGIISAISTFLTVLLRPILDAVLIFSGLLVIKQLWAHYYFDDGTYYTGSYIHWFFGFYTLMWLTGAYLSGWYSRDADRWLAARTIAYSTGLILIVYGLLPEHMRTSRALLGFGSIWAWLIIQFSHFIFKPKSVSHERLNTGIVANKLHADLIYKTISQSGKLNGEVYFISPENDFDNSFFTNSLSHISEVVKGLKIDELIFSAIDMPMGEIISTMSAQRLNVKYKIAGDKTLSIIGSNSKHLQGDIYSLELSYNLDKSYLKAGKRLMDLILCAVAVVISPFYWPLTFFGKKYWTDITEVFSGNKTWVGYGHDNYNVHYLPYLPPSVMTYGLSDLCISIEGDKIRNLHQEYAKTYHVSYDISYFFGHLYKIGQYSLI